MKHLRTFSKFNENNSVSEFRMPEEVNSEEFYKKLDNFSKVQFTTQEKEFLMSFGGERSDKRYTFPEASTATPYNIRLFSKCEFEIGIFNLTGSLFGQIDITKLDDDWYLISEYVSPLGLRNHYIKYYICDEWGEVLGYLSNRGFNI